MKKRLLCLSLVFIMLAMSGCVSRIETASNEVLGTYEEKALKFVSYLVSGEYESAYSMTDKDVKHTTVSTIEDWWKQITDELGEFVEIIDITETCRDNYGSVSLVIYSKHEKEGWRSLVNLNFGTNSNINTFRFDVLEDNPQPNTDPWGTSSWGKEFLGFLAAEDFVGAWEMFNGNMRESLSAADLQNYWQQITAILGSFVKVTTVKSNPEMLDNKYLVCDVLSEHTNQQYLSYTRLAFERDYSIAGLNFSIVENPNYTVEETESPLVSNESVTVGEETRYPLGATLSMPIDMEGPIPAVVLVHGSGASDRDESLGGQALFRDIAMYLAERGIAVLRYDKRSYTYGAEMIDEFGSEITVREEVIEDALLAKRLLEQDQRIDANKIYVLGHSMGGMLAPQIAEEGDFAGVIIMAGTMRSLLELMVEQYEYLCDAYGYEGEARDAVMNPVYAEYDTYTAALEMADEEAKALTVFGTSAYYFTDMAKRHPADYISRIDKPVLILQGSMDYQVRWDVDFAEYQSLAEDLDNVRCVLYEGLTHMFTQSHSETGMGTPEDYYYTEVADTAVLEDIAVFILD